LIIGQMGS